MRALPLSRTRTPLGQHAQQGGIGTNHRLDTYFTRVCSNRTTRKYCTDATQHGHTHSTRGNQLINNQAINQSTNQPINQSAITTTHNNSNRPHQTTTTTTTKHYGQGGRGFESVADHGSHERLREREFERASGSELETMLGAASTNSSTIKSLRILLRPP